jgi:hypothetical protein
MLNYCKVKKNKICLFNFLPPWQKQKRFIFSLVNSQNILINNTLLYSNVSPHKTPLSDENLFMQRYLQSNGFVLLHGPWYFQQQEMQQPNDQRSPAKSQLERKKDKRSKRWKKVCEWNEGWEIITLTFSHKEHTRSTHTITL